MKSYYDILNEATAKLRDRNYNDSVINEYLITDGRGTITGIRDKGKNLKEITIPSMISNERITAIGKGAFRKCTNLTTVIISEGIISIGEYAFADDSNLYIVKIPNSIKEIGEYAFANCKKLPNVNIPNTSVKISIGAFHGCVSLNGFKIPTNTEIINVDTFSGCENLTSIRIPDNVKTIASKAFWNCTNLSDVRIPRNIKVIGRHAFNNTQIKPEMLPERFRNNDGIFENVDENNINRKDGCTMSWTQLLESMDEIDNFIDELNNPEIGNDTIETPAPVTNVSNEDDLLNELNQIFTPILVMQGFEGNIADRINEAFSEASVLMENNIINFDSKTRMAQLISVCALLIARQKNSEKYQMYKKAAVIKNKMKLDIQKEEYDAAQALAQKFLVKVATTNNSSVARDAANELLPETQH